MRPGKACKRRPKDGGRKIPELYLFGGPNGAGKSTIALEFLPVVGCRHFVNADVIARALSPFDVDAVALQAGSLMMKRLRAIVKTEMKVSLHLLSKANQENKIPLLLCSGKKIRG